MSGDYEDGDGDRAEPKMGLKVWKVKGRYWVDLDDAIGQLEDHDFHDDPCIAMTLGWFRNARAIASEHLA